MPTKQVSGKLLCLAAKHIGCVFGIIKKPATLQKHRNCHDLLHQHNQVLIQQIYGPMTMIVTIFKYIWDNLKT